MDGSIFRHFLRNNLNFGQWSGISSLWSKNLFSLWSKYDFILNFAMTYFCKSLITSFPLSMILASPAYYTENKRFHVSISNHFRLFRFSLWSTFWAENNHKLIRCYVNWNTLYILNKRIWFRSNSWFEVTGDVRLFIFGFFYRSFSWTLFSWTCLSFNSIMSSLQ